MVHDEVQIVNHHIETKDFTTTHLELAFVPVEDCIDGALISGVLGACTAQLGTLRTRGGGPCITATS